MSELPRLLQDAAPAETGQRSPARTLRNGWILISLVLFAVVVGSALAQLSTDTSSERVDRPRPESRSSLPASSAETGGKFRLGTLLDMRDAVTLLRRLAVGT